MFFKGTEKDNIEGHILCDLHYIIKQGKGKDETVDDLEKYIDDNLDNTDYHAYSDLVYLFAAANGFVIPLAQVPENKVLNDFMREEGYVEGSSPDGSSSDEYSSDDEFYDAVSSNSRIVDKIINSVLTGADIKTFVKRGMDRDDDNTRSKKSRWDVLVGDDDDEPKRKIRSSRRRRPSVQNDLVTRWDDDGDGDSDALLGALDSKRSSDAKQVRDAFLEREAEKKRFEEEKRKYFEKRGWDIDEISAMVENLGLAKTSARAEDDEYEQEKRKYFEKRGWDMDEIAAQVDKLAAENKLDSVCSTCLHTSEHFSCSKCKNVSAAFGSKILEQWTDEDGDGVTMQSDELLPKIDELLTEIDGNMEK